MDRNAPSDYIETTADSLRDTERFIEHIRSLAPTGSTTTTTPLILPIITPRFIPTCSLELMRGLGQLAAKHNVHIQSHLR